MSEETPIEGTTSEDLAAWEAAEEARIEEEHQANLALVEANNEAAKQEIPEGFIPTPIGEELPPNPVEPNNDINNTDENEHNDDPTKRYDEDAA